MGASDSPEYQKLLQDVLNGRVPRRQLLKAMAALGLTATPLVTFLASCGGGAATSTPAASETASATSTTTGQSTGGAKTFKFGRYLDAIVPDPVMNDNNADIWYMQQYYSGLLRFKADTTVEGDLADKWEISQDQLTYTFQLKPGLKFSDGTPVKGSDFVWSINRAVDPKNGIFSFTLEGFDKIEATDTQVVITLKQPNVPFIYSMALFNTVVMPEALVAKTGGWEKFMLQPVGTGPYIMKEWVKGDTMTLVKNPNYWEQGKPLVDEILLKYIPEDNTRVLAVQKGDVDAINFPPKSQVAQLKTDSNLNVLQFNAAQVTQITVNNRNKPFDDKRVRQALSYAIDRDALIRTINFGIGIPAKTFRPAGTVYYDDSLPGWPYDTAKAQGLLKDAGYGSGIKATLQVNGASEGDKQAATVIKDMWSKIGVDLTIQELETGLWNDNYYNNKFEMQIVQWTDDIPDPSEQTNYAVVFATAESMHSGFQNSECDTLAAEGVKETDPEKRKAIYFRIQEIFNDEVPLIPLWHEPYLIVVRKNVKNFAQTYLGTYVWRDLDIS
ncbi:MAG: ABC transporter substrate-binding protein [Chloroflexi bacterium]|nr:ABC transporter substrate-binding protein [Chloroflexota bacterium]